MRLPYIIQLPHFPNAAMVFLYRRPADERPALKAVSMRKMLPNFLKPEALQRYVGIMDHIVGRHFANGWENRDEVEVFPLTKRYTFWLACRLFISVEDPAHVTRFTEPFNAIASGLISIPIDLPRTPFWLAIKASNFIRKELVLIIKQRKIDLAEGKASPTQDILSHMLLTADENGKFMPELEIGDKKVVFNTSLSPAGRR